MGEMDPGVSKRRPAARGLQRQQYLYRGHGLLNQLAVGNVIKGGQPEDGTCCVKCVGHGDILPSMFVEPVEESCKAKAIFTVNTCQKLLL
jgi:hypothetical protein